MDIQQRKFNLFEFFTDYRFGSLWRIKESFWHAHFSKYSSTRKWHPGFSIYRNEAKGLFPFIPMLFGSSSYTPCGFYVTGLTEERGDSYKTFFGVIEKPIPRCASTDFLGASPLITRNSYKPFANSSEIAIAKRWLRKQEGKA